MNLADKYKRYILTDRLTTRLHNPKIKLVNIPNPFKNDMLYYSNAVQVFDDGKMLLPALYFNYYKPELHIHGVWYEPVSGYVFKSPKLNNKYDIPETQAILDSGLLQKIEMELFYSD